VGLNSNVGQVGVIVDLDERREYVAQAIVRCEGNLQKTAFQLGIHRSHIYRLVWKHRLWPIVNGARRERLERRGIIRQLRGRL
jgi:hypothetical protein